MCVCVCVCVRNITISSILSFTSAGCNRSKKKKEKAKLSLDTIKSHHLYSFIIYEVYDGSWHYPLSGLSVDRQKGGAEANATVNDRLPAHFGLAINDWSP